MEALTRLGGIAAAGPIVALSSRPRLRAAVRRGEIRRLEHNRYALRVLDDSLTTARRLNGHLSHLSAALHHGWEVCFPPDRPQIALPTSREVDERATWGAETYRFDLPARERPAPATSPVTTVLLCARDLPFRDALAVADSALRHQGVAYDELVAAAESWPGPFRDRILKVATYADGRSANPFESALRAIAIETGLEVAPQWAVRAGSVTYHPDLADPWRGLAIEADSWSHHAASSADHDRDCERYNALLLAGWVVLRFTWSQVMLDASKVAAVLGAMRDRIDSGLILLG